MGDLLRRIVIFWKHNNKRNLAPDGKRWEKVERRGVVWQQGGNKRGKKKNNKSVTKGGGNPAHPTTLLNPRWWAGIILHRSLYTGGGSRCHMATHYNPHRCRAQRGGGTAEWESGGGEGELPGNMWTRSHARGHLCHTTTLLDSRHASCEEGRLTFHCLHNLDWPMGGGRAREKRRTQRLLGFIAPLHLEEEFRSFTCTNLVNV